MNATEAYPRLLEALSEVRRQWRLWKVLEGALLTLAGVAVVLLALVAADNLFKPDKLVRALLATVLWGTLGACLLSLVIRRLLEDRRDDFFAALVERKHPELHNQLINALQLGRGDQRGHSKDLIRAIIKDADQALVDTDPSDAIDRRPVRRAAVGALVALLLVAGYAGAMSPRFFNGLGRVLLPWSNIDPYTRTKITSVTVGPEDKPADKVTRIHQGKPQLVRVELAGHVPARVELHHDVVGSWRVVEMTPVSNRERTFEAQVPGARGNYSYYVTAGDARSAKFPMTVVRPPQVVKVEVVYEPPAYTARPQRRVTTSDGEVTGLPGTRVTLELTASHALTKAQLVLGGKEDGTTIDLAPKGDVYAASFTLWQEKAGEAVPEGLSGRLVGPNVYRIRMADSEGNDLVDPLERRIDLQPDQLPRVVLRAPKEKARVQATEQWPLVALAEDDHGLAELRVAFAVTRKDGRKEADKVLRRRDLTAGPPRLRAHVEHVWALAGLGLKAGDRVDYWAEATDRNNLTGPGKGKAGPFSLEIVSPASIGEKIETRTHDYIGSLKDVLRLQRQNRVASAASGTPAGEALTKDARELLAAPEEKGLLKKAEALEKEGSWERFVGQLLVWRETVIRRKTSRLAREMEGDGVPAATIIQALDRLAAGPMAQALTLLQKASDSADAEKGAGFRQESLPIQDKIIAELESILERLQRNEQVKKNLRKLKEKKPDEHKKVVRALTELIKTLDERLKDMTTTADKFERLPRKGTDKFGEERLKALNELEAMMKRSERWAKGSVQELTKMPKGHVDDNELRKDIHKVYEEIEKAATRSKAEKLEVSLEDLGAGLATKMKEDLEMWLPDEPDALKWVLEEPLNKRPMKIPEMPLPKALQDLVGDLLQKADEFDEDADDITSAWGDNLDQAGWGVSDGPISNFSAKGKTGNDQPNNMEVSGRSGDGRRGKSSGQMVGDTAKALPGRKTPARVGSEKYEPGQLKSEGQEDPNGATGGGKKTTSGRIGLQGGTPPEPSPQDIGRLSAKQAGMREKMEQVAKKLDSHGVSTTRIKEGIKLLDEANKDLADRRYQNAEKRRREAMKRLREGLGELDRTTAAQISRARDLPPEMRRELLQSSEAGYPAGYEGLLKSYYKALATEK